LWQYISSLGHDCEIIDLLRPPHSEFIPSRKYKSYTSRCIKKRIGSFVKKFIGIKKESKNNIALSLEQKRLKERFDEFDASIKMSVPYRQIDELYKTPPLYDIYITGSDQLWNPAQPFCIEPYFLTFAPKDKLRLSYAASIGIEKLSYKVKVDFARWLPQFHAVSVREEQAKKILIKIVDKEIEVMADPTFLIDISEWNAFAVKPDIKDKYLFLYTLHPNIELINYAIKLKDEKGYRLVVCSIIPSPRNDKEYYSVLDAGPKEFLGWIANAEMVITNSFHGTVFSILLGARNFYSFIPSENKRGSRIRNLLQTFSLEKHLLNNMLCQSYKELESNLIDRKKVVNIILQEQERSCGFLKKYL